MNETRLTGLDDVLKRLEQVAEKVAKKALSKATRKGGNVIRKAAIANAPVDSGDLRKHIALRLKVKPGAIAASALRVAPRRKTAPRITGASSSSAPSASPRNPSCALPWTTPRRPSSRPSSAPCVTR